MRNSLKAILLALACLLPLTALGEESGPTHFPRALSVAAGWNHTLALLDDGSVLAWGSNTRGQLGLGCAGLDSFRDRPVKVDGFDGLEVVKLAAGHDFSLALCANGTVYAWGNNDTGQLGLGDTETRNQILTPTRIPALDGAGIVEVAAGFAHCAAVSATGAVYLWGANEMGQLGLGDRKGRSTPTLNAALADVVSSQVSCGRWHTAVQIGRASCRERV